MNEQYKYINFRKLEEKDLELLYHWLNDSSDVMKWYTKHPVTMERVKTKYTSYINGEKPTKAFIILFDKKPIGYIQTFSIDSYPKYKELIGIDEESTGLDLYIGEDDYIHMGLGSIIIRKFLKEYTFKIFQAKSCIIGPEPANKAAIRSYEKAGFTYMKTIYNDNEEGYEYLMKLDRSEL